MEAVGDYKIEWPTKADPRYRPTDWLAREKAANRVFDMGGAKRLVVRGMPEPEPKRPFQHNGGRADHHARSGVGALAHSIGNEGNESWKYLSDFMATGCAKSSAGLLNGHASTHMHVLWGSLGAALASEKDFREYMEGIRWWFIMAQTHDGSYVVMPGRDYASTDHLYGTRNFPTACAALILSLKEQRLQITGAARGKVAQAPAAGRVARSLSAEKRALLDASLLEALGELGQAGELKPLPMELSKAEGKVWLAKVEVDSRLTFQAAVGEVRASFPMGELTAADRALLARLVARLKPTDGEAQARAAIYLELAGDAVTADAYLSKLGPDLRAMVDGLFE